VDSLSEYLTQLASDAPTPGGGSAATIVAAMGAALVAMVARINGKNPKYASHLDDVMRIVARADELRERLLKARARDEAAFAAVMEAYALPKEAFDDHLARRAALEEALAKAAAEPLECAKACLEVLHLAARSLLIPNKNLISDVGCAVEFAGAGLAACAFNVRVNHRFMQNEHTISEQAHVLERYEREAAALLATVRKGVATMLTRQGSSAE
jgi:formiminotetrahydrofolate cyclodeaminase